MATELFTHRDLTLDWSTRQTRVGTVTDSFSFLQTTILRAHYGIPLDRRNELMGMGDHATARLA